MLFTDQHGNMYLIMLDMKSYKETTTTTTLVLNDYEKNWLMAIVQNPLNTDESLTDNEMRKKIWNALNIFSVHQIDGE